MITFLTEIAICGFVGMILHMLMKAKDLQTSARKNNIEFKFSKFFIDDWLSHMISVSSVVLYLFLARRRVVTAPDSMYELILAFSATVGYAGDSLVSRFFSFTTKRIDAAIDYKTTIADQATGNTGTPTPAEKPK